MRQKTDSHTLDEFLKNPLEHLKRLRETKEAEVFDVGDNQAIVMLDFETYRMQCAQLEQAELIASIADGIESMKKGEGIPIEEAYAKLEREFPFLKRS